MKWAVCCVREHRHLRDEFHILPEYLEDAAGLAEEVNFSNYGPQLSRGFRGLETLAVTSGVRCRRLRPSR